jgi:hypothetical protein
MKKTFLIILILLALGRTGMSQNIIHVATDGSDNTGDGSLNNPYATISKASNKATPGDTVYVHEGTYQNPDFGDGDIWKNSSLGTISCNGTEEAWITFKPFPGDYVLFETDARGIIIKGTYIVFSGFDLKGMADQITMEEAVSAWGLYKDSLGVVHDLAQELGIDYNDPELWGQVIPKPVLPNIKKPNYYNASLLVANKTHHVIMENNLIRDACASGARNQGGDYIIFRNNTIIRNTYWTSVGVGALTVATATVYPEGDSYEGVKIIIESNFVHNNENRLVSWNPYKDFIHWVIDEGSGIFLTRNNDTYDHGYMLIANNASYLNGASGIVVHKTNRAIVENNTCYYNGTTNGDGKAGGIGLNSTDDVTIINNISWANPNKSAFYKQGGELTNLTIEANLLYNEDGPQDITSGVPDEGWTEANPLLVDAENFDFRLTSQSPAINNGVENIYITNDITGYPRNDGHPDIGAYEYQSGLGIAIHPAHENFILFPNPADKTITIKSKSKNWKFTIFTISGQTVKSVTNSKPVQNINITDLKPGIYVIKSDHCSRTFIKK